MYRPGRSLTMSIAAAALLVSGCYHRESRDGTAIYSFAWCVPAGGLVVGMASVASGWWLRHWGHRAGGRVWIACAVLIFWGAILLLILVPGTYFDRVIVDSDHFETDYGFWWSPTHRNVRFDE